MSPEGEPQYPAICDSRSKVVRGGQTRVPDFVTTRDLEIAYEDIESQLVGNPPIQVPTIVLHGEEDGATLVHASEGKEHLSGPRYERLVLPGVGHLVPREAPAPSAEAVRRLVGGGSDR
jgi:pimeloyl-ACP methyl ester carboxylesterase